MEDTAANQRVGALGRLGLVQGGTRSKVTLGILFWPSPREGDRNSRAWMGFFCGE